MNTAEQMYRYFLTEVRKERTVVITPDQWTDMINPILMDWVKTKLPDSEFNQKRLDDLTGIKVITDNVQFCSIPQIYDAGNIFRIPYAYPGYPVYMHGISAQFATQSIPVGPGGCGGGNVITPLKTTLQFIPIENPDRLVGVIGGKIFRSDKRAVTRNNPYRQPDDSTYVYFEQKGGFIYVQSNGTKYKHMILEYYAYPERIKYSSTIDESGSFQPTQNKEIMDMAVTRYLERVSDQRIQTQPSVSAQVPK